MALGAKKSGTAAAASAGTSTPDEDGDVIYVNSAQVKAARLLVDNARRRKEPVDPAVLAIANAKRANGHTVTSTVTASSTPLRPYPGAPSPA